VPAKIIQSGHQIELKMYEHHFYKDAWEEGGIKTQKGGKYEDQHESAGARYVPLA